ncbi:uncharacterized protein [Nicotiana sylvestris]|uniref:uncharacterized protein n=1 Tax=Nicotiana sylvestris TaxID=4096 RepID=UPI00388C7889
MCNEMREQLRAGASTQSAREELEKRDEDLMWSIHRCSELEELLHAKSEELEGGKRVAVECEDLQANVLSLRAELEQNDARVNALNVKWAEKVAELEKAEDARVSVLARAAALEDTIRVLRSEKESERATTTMREARLEEHIGEIDREASNLGDRVTTLEAEKAQLLAQAESVSTSVPRRLYELWVHAEAQRDIYKDARAKAREARVACGYDPATLEVGEGIDVEDGLPDENDGENNGGDEAK